MRPSLLENLKALPRAAWILFAGTFINRFGSFVIVFLVIYLTKRGYSPAMAGFVLGAYGFGSLCASYLGGQLADRIGRRNTILLSMLTSAVSLIGLAMADGLGAITFLTALTGFTSELYRPASSALLADLTEPQQRLTAFAVYRLAINAGVACGPIVAGFLAERSFFYLFVGDALTSLIFGAIALTALPNPRREVQSTVGEKAALGTIFADRAFVRVLLAGVLISFVFFQFESTFPLHVMDLGFSNATYGALLSINGFLIVAMELALTVVTSRYEPRFVIALGYLLVGAGFAVNLVAFTIPAMAAGIVLWTFGEIVSSPVISAYVAGLAPESLRGRYMGIWGLTFSLGLILGPSLGTILYAENASLLWVLCGVFGIIAAWLIARNPDTGRIPMSGV